MNELMLIYLSGYVAERWRASSWTAKRLGGEWSEGGARPRQVPVVLIECFWALIRLVRVLGRPAILVLAH